MNSKQFYSLDNFFSLLLGYFSVELWLLLALELIIRGMRGSEMLEIKLEGGGTLAKRWKNNDMGNVFHYIKKIVA